jgi:ribosomal protein S13
MKRSKEILSRVKSKDQLRAAGLTEDEINELADLKADFESQDQSFKRAVQIESELTELRRRE